MGMIDATEDPSHRTPEQKYAELVARVHTLEMAHRRSVEALKHAAEKIDELTREVGKSASHVAARCRDL